MENIGLMRRRGSGGAPERLGASVSVSWKSTLARLHIKEQEMITGQINNLSTFKGANISAALFQRCCSLRRRDGA